MMNTKEFLSTVLGEEGYYCAYGIRLKDGKHKSKFYSSIDSIIDTALNLDFEGYDAYYALGTFIEENNRQADNVRQMRSFFLDIDCGKGKPYPDKSSGLRALQGFCKQFSLPKPTITVDSGGGLHAYWAFDKPCTRQEWLPVATRLKKTCLDNGFQIDPAVTADAARLLRLPNSRNFKFETPADVKVLGQVNPTIILEEFAKLLPYPDLIPVMQERDYTDADRENAKNLTGNNLVKKFSNILIKDAEGKGCAQIRRALFEPDALSYNDWTHVLSVAKHCEEPEAIHVVSQGYKGYSHAETEKVADSLHSPHLCTTFEGDNPKGCDGCPLRGRIKSPINLSYEIKEATEEDNIIQIPDPSATVPADSGLFDNNEEELNPVATIDYEIPAYPKPYFRGAYGGVYVRSFNKDTKEMDEVAVYDRDLYLTKRIQDPIDGPCFEFKHHTKLEGIVTFVAKGTALTSKDECRKVLGENDIHLIRPDNMMNYIQAWVKELQSSKSPVEAKTQFGWTENMQSFILGDREIFADRVEENPASSFTAQYMPMFKRRGTLEAWAEAMKFYEKDGMEPHQFMVATSIGSILMNFVPNIRGCINHVYSTGSGYGKSTGMIVGASIWANPEEYIMNGQSTANSIWNRAEVMKNLPIYIDEATNMEGNDISDIAYAVTSGKQKTRMTNGGHNKERYQGKAWSLMLGSNGNASFIDGLARAKEIPKGEIQRVIETRLEKLDIPEEETFALNMALTKNHGLAGEKVVQEILRDVTKAQDLVFNLRKLVIARANLNDQNRNWSAATACTIAGAILMKRCGLWSVDIDKLFEWSLSRLGHMKAVDSALGINIGDLIRNYYFEKQGQIIRIKSTQDGRSRDESGLIETLVNPEKLPHYAWVGRYEYDVKQLYLLIKPFKAWIEKKPGINYAEVAEEIEKHMRGEKKKVHLGKGTTVNIGSVYVLSLSFDAGDVDEEELDIPEKVESLYEPKP